MIPKAQSLDNFIDKSLYEKNKGYYQRKVEFGRRGDFITSPGISKLFSEMIAIWVVSFWENLNKPEKINLVELGAGNGELIEVLINTLNKLEIVKDKFKFFIFEKSVSLKKLQKKKFSKNVKWLDYFDKLGFNIIGYGCTTCIGNSGPLDDNYVSEINDNGIKKYITILINRNNKFINIKVKPIDIRKLQRY